MAIRVDASWMMIVVGEVEPLGAKLRSSCYAHQQATGLASCLHHGNKGGLWGVKLADVVKWYLFRPRVVAGGRRQRCSREGLMGGGCRARKRVSREIVLGLRWKGILGPRLS